MYNSVQPYTQADIATGKCVAIIIVADPDPGSGIRIRDEKNGSGTWIQIRNNGLRNTLSGCKVPDNFSESLEPVFTAKNTKILWCGSGIFLTLYPESFWPWIRDGKIRIQDKHPGPATLAVTHQCNFKLKSANWKGCLLFADPRMRATTKGTHCFLAYWYKMPYKKIKFFFCTGIRN